MSSTLRESQPTNIRWYIVLMLMGFTFLGHFNRNNISVVGSERFIKSGEITQEQMGWVYSTFLLVYTCGMLPGGWLIDKLGPQRALAGMGIGMGCCVVMTGLLGFLKLPLAAMLLPLIAIRGLAGALSVALHPAAARSVSLWVPFKERSTANGLVTAGALIGVALCYPLFGWLMDTFQWPQAFVICGVTMILFAVLWSLVAADDVHGHSWANEAERNLQHVTDRVPARSTASLRDFLRLFGNVQLLVLTLSYAMLSYFQYLFFYWLGFYFDDTLKLPTAESRQATFTVLIAMAVGMAFGGWCSDRLCRMFGHRTGCRLMAMTGMSASALFALLGVSTTDPQQIVFYFALALGSLGLCEGIFWTTAPTLEKRTGGLACAFLNAGGNAGGLLAPIFTPYLAKHYGWPAAISVACLVCALGGILWFGIDSEAGRSEPVIDPAIT
jgi:ACS family D-galactonate transporter-like MFS transporter